MFVGKFCPCCISLSFRTTHTLPPPTGPVSGTEQLGAINFELRSLSYCKCVCVSMCEYTLFPTAIIALSGSLAYYAVCV